MLGSIRGVDFASTIDFKDAFLILHIDMKGKSGCSELYY